MLSRADNDEIEITPEMIEAGVRAYYSVDMRVADQEFLVAKIFEAMAAARPEITGPTLEERKQRLATVIDGYDREDLRGAQFLRLLRLAHDEGLLDELLHYA